MNDCFRVYSIVTLFRVYYKQNEKPLGSAGHGKFVRMYLMPQQSRNHIVCGNTTENSRTGNTDAPEVKDLLYC